jgi:hypothetical protein
MSEGDGWSVKWLRLTFKRFVLISFVLFTFT